MMAFSVLPIVLWNGWASLALGLLLNALLLFLALRHSSGDLREYRRVVFYFCSLNILCLFFYALTLPILLISKDGRSLVFLYGLVANFSSIGIRLAFASFYLSISLGLMAGLGLQFLDRYLLVCRSFTNVPRRYALVIGLQLLLPIATILISLNVVPAKDFQVDEILPSEDGNALKNNSSGENGADAPNLKVVSDANMQNQQTKALFAILGILSAAKYLTVIICYGKIRAYLKRNLAANGPSTNTRDSLQQITRNMLFQALLPMYAMGLLLFCISLVLNSEYSSGLLQFQILIFVPTSWLPILNPLVTILTIRNYRTGLLAICGWKKIVKQNEVNVFKTSTHPIVTTIHHSTVNK